VFRPLSQGRRADALGIAGRPSEWAEPFAKLQCGPPPGDVDIVYWVRLLPGANQVAEEWAAQAHAIVLGLHDLVAGGEARSETFDPVGHVRVQGLLEIGVQYPRAERAALHRAEDLDVADRVQAETLRDPVPDDLDDLGGSRLGLAGLDEIEIGRLVALGSFRHLAATHAVGVNDDPARRLPERLGQPGDRQRAGGDDVGENLPGADGGELVDVAGQEQSGVRRDRLDDREQQRRVDHARLVEDEEIAVEGIVGVAAEAAVLRVGLLGHALCCAAGRRRPGHDGDIGLQDRLNGARWEANVFPVLLSTQGIDYDREVFNGDLGRVIRIDQAEGVLWADFDGREVEYPFGEFDMLVPAYATTIQKSKGSEYPAVVVTLATQHYTMLARNLVYTAVTRGKRLTSSSGSGAPSPSP